MLDCASPPLLSEPFEGVGLSDRLSEYLALTGSTTFFLGAFSEASVKVQVLRQYFERDANGERVLRRLSRLYLRRSDEPVVVADSTVAMARLTPSQQERLISKNEGIGKLLDPDNLGLIEKCDIEVVRVRAPRSLRTRSRWAICRRFALLYNGAACAEIREVLNNESLGRLP